MSFKYFIHNGFKCKALNKNYPVKNVSVRNLVDKSEANEFISDLINGCLEGTKYTLKSNQAWSMTDKVTLNCPDHGDFESSPSAIRLGRSCKGCQLERLWNSSRSGKEVFIEKAQKIHGITYGYEHVLYVNSHTKVKIKCDVHGIFEQTPNTHLHGKRSGCPACGQIKRTESVRNFARGLGYSENMKERYLKLCQDGTNLYVMKFSNQSETFYKVGVSKNIPVRLYNLRHNSPYKVELLGSWEFNNAEEAYTLEQKILSEFTRYVPETSFGGSTECTLNLMDIKKHLEV